MEAMRVQLSIVVGSGPFLFFNSFCFAKSAIALEYAALAKYAAPR
jgi:hypothetical protein